MKKWAQNKASGLTGGFLLALTTACGNAVDDTPVVSAAAGTLRSTPSTANGASINSAAANAGAAAANPAMASGAGVPTTPIPNTASYGTSYATPPYQSSPAAYGTGFGTQYPGNYPYSGTYSNPLGNYASSTRPVNYIPNSAYFPASTSFPSSGSTTVATQNTAVGAAGGTAIAPTIGVLGSAIGAAAVAAAAAAAGEEEYDDDLCYYVPEDPGC